MRICRRIPSLLNYIAGQRDPHGSSLEDLNKLRSVNDESIRSLSHYILPLDRSDSYYIKPV
jgi:hypothetical protein